MSGISVPSQLSGIYSGSGASAGNTSGASGAWGSGVAPKPGDPAAPLATAQTPQQAATAQPSFVAAGMNASGMPDYITNWLAQGGTGVNPADPNTPDVPQAGGELTVGTGDPGAVNNITAMKLPMPGRTPGRGSPKAILPGTPPAAAVPRPAGQAPGVPGGAPGTPGAAPATPGAPGATPGTPGATLPGGSMYDPRYGQAPALDPKVTNRFGISGPPGNFAAPTSQDMEGVTDQQLTTWLQRGGGQGDNRVILGPEQVWQSQGKYADPASIRAYAMWRLGMGNGLAASSGYQQPQQQQNRWGS